MKRSAIYFSLTFVAVAAGIPLLSGFVGNDTEAYTSNKDLRTLAPFDMWQGTPINEDGTFRNLYQPFDSRFSDLVKWKLSKNPLAERKKKDSRTLSVQSASELVASSDDYLIWLGHASFLIKKEGVTYLIDPILIDNFFLKRQSELPLSLSELPAIDYILISHNHRDHCDRATIEFLAERYPHAEFLTGLGVGKVIAPWLSGQQVQEAGWFQQYTMAEDQAEVIFVPTRHWSRRGLSDENKTLWGGFYFRFTDTSVYFMGDSGYGPHYMDIRNALGSPDYALLGVGAFEPKWFMHQSHISPTDAIKVFHELEGRFFFPMHFGTFDLSDEPLLMPLDILLENEGEIDGTLIFPTVGKNIW
ncbi:putative Zn-dependent hydrolase [Lunatimonas lonarensis]|uniref:Putative Zn-dependent hydrolase n=1 Tax=Lunatimonas lonarensis TaxID=1232681 RepID=R7ZP66_9BACT|nr:MBL fold metallo-hydrolase [Lunatimonas lonarensis]EON75895.1 putative Zn-dependent hydrolase [Lunatimonas lonarensis]